MEIIDLKKEREANPEKPSDIRTQGKNIKTRIISIMP